MSGRCRPGQDDGNDTEECGLRCRESPVQRLVSAHRENGRWDHENCSSDELRRVLREQAGLDLIALAPAQGGESKSTSGLPTAPERSACSKIMPGAAPGAAGHPRALDAVLARLRDRGYPAPRFRAIGHVPGLAFWVQQRMPGDILDRGRGEPDRAAQTWLLPELLG